MTTPTAFIREPLPFQWPMWMSEARFKLSHHGRRWGKDGVAFPSAMTGHGGKDPWASPLYKGVAHGFSVAWLVRDYSQAKGIWIEQILPRFKHLRPTVRTNENDMMVTLPNGGRLFMCSTENVESIRGLGASMAGVVINEAAHLDLEHAWGRVIRPILVDNKGWGILMSTPLRGSYFNALAEKIRDGQMEEPGWERFEGDAFENTALDQTEVTAWAAGYIQDSPEQLEEVYGRLLQGGRQMAFPMFYLPVHAPQAMDEWMPPQHWHTFLGLDWATTGQAVCYLMAHNGPNQIAVLREWLWSDKDSYEAGSDIADQLLLTPLTRWPDACWVDDQMALKSGIGGTTLLAEFQRGVDDVLRQTRAGSLPCMPAPKGPGSRLRRFDVLRRLLAWEQEPGTMPKRAKPGKGPCLKIAPGHCPRLVRSLPRLKTVERKKGEYTWTEDFVDPAQPEDDFYDAVTYGLVAAFPPVDQPLQTIPNDVHPGFLPSGRRRSRIRTPEIELEEAMEMSRHTGQQTYGGSYGPRAT